MNKDLTNIINYNNRGFNSNTDTGCGERKFGKKNGKNY